MVPAHLKMVTNVMVAKFELAFTQCWNDLKKVQNLMIKKLLQDFDAKEMHLHPKNQPKSIKRCSVFSSFSSVYTMLFPKCASSSSVFKIYHIQNLIAKMFHFRVNRRPIRHIFHHFQNVV